MIRAALCVPAILLSLASAATAQLISIRTVPVSQSHQFDIFPSRTAAMGGVSIAVIDSVRDPFANPAQGARLEGTRFFGSPAAYSVSSDAGGGRTLPVGALTKRGPWYGGLWLALQEVDLTERPDLSWIRNCLTCLTTVGLDLEPAERSQGNTYAFAMMGRQLADGLSIGGSVLYSRLNAIDGVDLLYSGAARIDQFGSALDVRLGLTKEWSGARTLEAIVLHNRFGTTHDVFFLDSFWDPATQQFSQRSRLDKNLDRTNTWGLHLAYEQPLATEGWRTGALFTFNRMDHPKIPNYSIMNIPRDPGNSSAFNVGFGIARVLAGSTFAVDVIYEPIWSHTWADSESPIVALDGRTIQPGGMTIENRFRFSNAQLRLGVGQEAPLGEDIVGGLQLGLGVRTIHYWLDQTDHVQLSDRSHEERWTEWSPTWGLSLAFPALEVRYEGSVTNGTGRPGVGAPRGVFVEGDAVALSSNILVAPSGPLTLDEVRVTSHRVSISLPVR
jgi:hypothetical protein